MFALWTLTNCFNSTLQNDIKRKYRNGGIHSINFIFNLIKAICYARIDTWFWRILDFSTVWNCRAQNTHHNYDDFIRNNRPPNNVSALGEEVTRAESYWSGWKLAFTSFTIFFLCPRCSPSNLDMIALRKEKEIGVKVHRLSASRSLIRRGVA